MAYKSKDRLRAEQCIKDGICMGCRKQKEADRLTLWYCKHCAYLKRNKQREELEKFTPEVSPWAGTIVCKGCRKRTFYTHDRRKRTRCEKCRLKLERMEDLLACEEARYETDEWTKGNMFLPQTNVGKMSSAKQKQAQAIIRQGDYYGITCRHLSKREIVSTYTPERIDAILDRAKRNFAANQYVPDLVQL